MTDWAEAAYADLIEAGRQGRPYVVVNMIASVDGAIAVDGRTAKLGGPADHHLFHYLRSIADVILVGAQTVRAERYGPPRITDERQAERRARGQSALPRLAIVSRSLDLDWSSRLFTEGFQPVVVVPEDADPERVAKAQDVADVIKAGHGGVDLVAALGALGPGLVLCEGGPTLNAELARADLVDELCLTVAPSLVGGTTHGLLGAGFLPTPLELDVVSMRLRDGDLFLRYRRSDRSVPPPSQVGSTSGGTFEAIVADLEYPMTIVTAAADGERSGCLVGFSTQVSIHPRRFGVWISKANHTHRVALAADAVAVHFPSAADRALVELFGGSTGDDVDKFAACRWHDGPAGVPVLDDLGRWFAGRVVDHVDTGDHTLLVLAPLDGQAGPWPGQLGFQDVRDLRPGHPA